MKSLKQPQLRKIGLRLRTIRESAGVSQTEIGELLKVEQASVSRIEGGHQNLTAYELSQLVRFFGITYEEFLGGSA